MCLEDLLIGIYVAGGAIVLFLVWKLGKRKSKQKSDSKPTTDNDQNSSLVK